MGASSTSTTLIPRKTNLKINDLDDCGSELDKKGSSKDDSPVQKVLSTLSVTPILPPYRRGRSPSSVIFRYENTPEPQPLSAQQASRSGLNSRLQEKCMKPCRELDGEQTRVEKSGTSQDSATRPLAAEGELVLQTFKQRLASLACVGRDAPLPQYRFKIGRLAAHLLTQQSRM